jgi:hypothetical protein
VNAQGVRQTTMYCWARTRGDCCNTQSGEHYISAALFSGLTMRIQGFSWCRNKEVEIPVSRARANILCKHHNEALSPLDSAGTRGFRALRAAWELHSIREKMRPHPWMIKQHKIQGRLLERWFLKTLVNLVCAEDGDIGWADGSPRAAPPPALVDCCFGPDRLVLPMGLYMIAASGMELADRDFLRFSPLLESGRIVAGIFEFCGFHFLLSVWNEPLPEGLFQANGPKGSRAAELMYHPRVFEMRNGGRLSQVVRLTWK